MMNRTLMAGALAVALLSACSKSQPVAELPRPVVVQKLALSPVVAGALYSGEVRARYESDLAFRIGAATSSRSGSSMRAARSSSDRWTWVRW